MAVPEKQKCEHHDVMSVVDFGQMKKQQELMMMTAFPAGAGFPFFTWAQVFFTGNGPQITKNNRVIPAKVFSKLIYRLSFTGLLYLCS